MHVRARVRRSGGPAFGEWVWAMACRRGRIVLVARADKPPVAHFRPSLGVRGFSFSDWDGRKLSFPILGPAVKREGKLMGRTENANGKCECRKEASSSPAG